MMSYQDIFQELDNAEKTNVLILGATGMLGAALFHQIPKVSSSYNVWGTFRTGSRTPIETERAKLVQLDDVFSRAYLKQLIESHDIHVVVNAIGLIKQISSQLQKSDFVKINAWLPHFLSELCHETNTRFIEISTDCVFTGKKGNYSEEDDSDATDLYGVTKFLGEVSETENAVTLRTSIIGHESGRAASLIDWFLSSKDKVEGYQNAIFSGFPTVFLSHIIGYFVIPNKELQGLYHVSAKPINKFALLKKVSQIYDHNIAISPNARIKIDRSLNSEKFKNATGFTPPDWDSLIFAMKTNRPVWNTE